MVGVGDRDALGRSHAHGPGVLPVHVVGATGRQAKLEGAGGTRGEGPRRGAHELEVRLVPRGTRLDGNGRRNDLDHGGTRGGGCRGFFAASPETERRETESRDDQPDACGALHGGREIARTRAGGDCSAALDTLRRRPHLNALLSESWARPAPEAVVASKGRILLLENIHPGAKAQLEQDGYEVELQAKALSEADLIKAGEGCIAVGIRSKTRVTKGALSALAPSLRSIGAFCIGTNQVDLARARARGVPVFNAPFSNTRSVAELIIAEVVMLARQLGDRVPRGARGQVAQGVGGLLRGARQDPRHRRLRPHRLAGGRARRGHGHAGGLLRRRRPSSRWATTRPASLDELLAVSDFVTLHVPATPQTHRHDRRRGDRPDEEGRVPAQRLSRGTVVDPALAARCASGHLGGAAIDVYPEEPEGNGDGFVTSCRGCPT
jgi:phosphoglycerate dehydrogenase-like enzyme